MSVGQLYNNPGINYVAFQNATKKAWRNVSVVTKPLENELQLLIGK